tara:strand:+ start:292 stop:606 length:315 start_codon:yes stop_codon:yes gene_type:complete
MLPKSFQQQNIENKNALISQMKLYTFMYDYELTQYYGEYIKESYDRWGNMVDNLGIMKLTGYSKEEAAHNFRKLMTTYYIHQHKIKSFEIINVEEELVISKPIL